MPPLYVPVLKGKEGEYAALEALSADVKNLILPLIEIPDIPYDHANERDAKTLDEHVAGVADRLQRCMPNAAIFLHLPALGENEYLADGTVAISSVLESCARNNVTAIPVLTRQSSPDYLRASATHAARMNTGFAIRLFIEDFEEDIAIENEVSRILNDAQVANANDTDLIVDLGDLGSDAGRASLLARYVLQQIPQAAGWRRVVLAAASFPEDLSEVDAATTVTLPRHEWSLWQSIQRRPGTLPRHDLIFGDYAISHPIFKGLDPRIMRMSASIRYTTTDEWLIVKGRNVRQYGFAQYFELCQLLVNRPEYRGREFSWGDRFIAECAERTSGPGNATTWRKVGVNHHLTLVARALANLHHEV